jgi:predicted RNA polymerase sigma factor
VLQAAIAACHARARRFADTDWEGIARLYERLAEAMPSPVVELNRAVALSKAFRPETGLALLDQLMAFPAMQNYPGRCSRWNAPSTSTSSAERTRGSPSIRP